MAILELVKNKPDWTGALAVAAIAQVGGERLGALARRAAAAVVFLPERRRETFLFLAPGNVGEARDQVATRGRAHFAQSRKRLRPSPPRRPIARSDRDAQAVHD